MRLFLFLLLLPVCAALFSLWSGLDARPAGRNLVYLPWAWLGDRSGQDILPPENRDDFRNPLALLPYWWLEDNYGGRITAVVMGSVHGLAGAALFLVARILLPSNALFPCLAGIVAGLLSREFLLSIGGPSTDPLLSLFFLLSVALVAAAVRRDHTNPWFAAAGGSCAGVAAGLDTAFLPLVCGFLLPLAMPGFQRQGRALLVAMAWGSAIAVFLVLSLPWLMTVHETYGSSLALLLRLPWPDPASIPADGSSGPDDNPWLPGRTGDNPVLTLVGISLSDWRFLLSLAALAWGFVLFVIPGEQPGKGERAFTSQSVMIRPIADGTGKRLIWTCMCTGALLVTVTGGETRLPLVMMTPLLFLALVSLLSVPLVRQLLWLLLTAFPLLPGSGESGERIPFPARGNPYAIFRPDIRIVPDGLVLVAGKMPLAHVIPFFPRGLRWLGVQENFLPGLRGDDLRALASQIVPVHGERLYALFPDREAEEVLRALARHGTSPRWPDCVGVYGYFPDSLLFCPLARPSVPRSPQ